MIYQNKALDSLFNEKCLWLSAMHNKLVIKGYENGQKMKLCYYFVAMATKIHKSQIIQIKVK